jgi:hypothetical protein
LDIQNKTLLAVSTALNVPAEWLYRLVQFESGWEPQKRAYMPLNAAAIKRDPKIKPIYAEGLVQFTPDTARMLGFKDAHDLVTRQPTIETQLPGAVLDLLSRYKPFPTEQSLYLSIFYPAARNWPPNQMFSDSVRAANPGINTPQDYVNHVKGIKLKSVAFAGIIILLLIGLFIYLAMTHKLQLT